MQRRVWLLYVMMLAFILAACGGGDDNSEESNDINPTELIESAAQRLDDTTSFELDLSVEGEPVNLSAETIGQAGLSVAVVGAEGTFVRPDGLEGTVQISLDDAVTDVGMVVVGSTQYLRHTILTLGRWQQVTFSEGFDAGNLANGEDSIAAALRAIQDVEYVERTDIDGLAMHHLRGTIQAERVSAVTVGLIGDSNEPLTIDIYLRTNNSALERMIVTEPVANGETIWTVNLYNYGVDYTITEPDV